MNCPEHNILMSLVEMTINIVEKSIPYSVSGQHQPVGSTGFTSFTGVRYKETLVDDNEYEYECPHGCKFCTKSHPNINNVSFLSKRMEKEFIS